MYLNYSICHNERLKFARHIIRSRHKLTYAMTYALVNISVILLVLSFFFYNANAPIMIGSITITQHQDLMVFILTAMLTILMLSIIWHFNRHFCHLHHLALEQTGYSQVEIWADAKQVRYRLDSQEYQFCWSEVQLERLNYYQSTLTAKDTDNQYHTVIIPKKHFPSKDLIRTIIQWQENAAAAMA